MYPVSLRDEIRAWVLIQGKSQRAAARHFDVSRNTVDKLLQEEKASLERRYQRERPATLKTPVRDLALPYIQGWLKENEWLSRLAPKQCWSAHRMWVELRKLDISIGESTVRLFVRELRKPTKPAYVPLDCTPGERAEFDFGEATVKVGGQLVPRPVPGRSPSLFGSHVCGMLPHPTARSLFAGSVPCVRVLGWRAAPGGLRQPQTRRAPGPART